MIQRIAVIVLLLAGLSWAQSTTRPSATQPTADQAKSSYPTPADLVARMKQRRADEMTHTKIAYIDLSDPITEQPTSFSLFGGADTHSLHEVLERLSKAKDDKSLAGVLITLGADTEIKLAQAQEIRDALNDLRRAGKKTFVYADSYDTAGYTIASAATNVCLARGGEIMIPGVGMEAMFYKGTFDKLGVTADYIQIGEYKGAEEPYTRTGASEELKGELSHLSEAMFTQIIDGISLSRSLPAQTVRQMIDDAMMTAQVAKDRGFVDHLVELDEMRGLIHDEIGGGQVDLIHDYAEPETPELDFSNPLLLLAALNRKPEASNRPQVAVIYVDGVISDGDGGVSLLGDSGVGSDSMRRELRIAARDENIKAVVLRIDSPGGSALASEVIWQAIRRISQESKKPVIVSIGSMAASGGYYLASAGDHIFADRCAIVGSIGVVGGKFVLKDLYDKLGLTTQTFTQGRNADLFSSNQPFTDRQRRMVRTWMQQTYDQFTQRVMTTRQGKIKDIDQVARGRIFLAEQAKQLGLVDELGGCDAAIAYAASQAGLSDGGYDVRQLPEAKSLMDYLTGHGTDAKSPLHPTISISPDSALLSLAPSLRNAISQQLSMVRLLQQRPVVLMSPFVIDGR